MKKAGSTLVFCFGVMFRLNDTKVLVEKKAKHIKKCYFGSQGSCQDKVTGFEKDKYGTFKSLGLIATQCKCIAACAYSSKNICVVQWSVSVVLRLLFLFFWANGPE